MQQDWLYVGLDVHKKTIFYCVMNVQGKILREGSIPATRAALLEWVHSLDQPWVGAMEATLFTGWIYDFFTPHAQELKVAHPLMMRAICASKKKNDKVDARKLANALRADLLPECYMAPSEIRELRRVLRFRSLVVEMAVKMKNKCSGLLMEVGAEYDKKRLHQKKYFGEMLAGLEEVPESVKQMLSISRAQIEMFQACQKKLVKGLRDNPKIAERVERLRSIRGVGEIVALTWVLEVGECSRFSSIGRALSYCGLTSAQDESGGKSKRGPLSKQRNRHLQTILIEAAKLAPRFNPQLRAVHERELARGNKNRATLAVARKLVAYLLAVDRGGDPFEERQSG
jgi:transposase